MRLIDADKTIGLLKTRLYETALNTATETCDASYLYTYCADNRIETWIDEMPTVDAVEVVRCKDCEWKEVCKINFEYKGADGYCSKGKRKEDAETD